LILFYFGFFGILGFFLLGMNGEAYALAFALLLLVVTLFLGDRIFLVLIRAKSIEPRNQKVLYNLQNLSCLKGIGEVRVYVSFLVPVNAYCIHPFFGDPCLIFSREVIEQADEEVISNAIEKAIAHFEKKRLRFAHFVSLLTSLLLLPKFWLESLRLGYLGVVYSYLFFPIVFVKDYMMAAAHQRGLEETSSSHSTELRAVYFLERFSRQQEGFLAGLAEDFSLYPKRKMGLWAALLGDYNSISNSYLKWHERKV
jgi:hypothetical protein